MDVPMQGYVCGVCLLWVCACVLSYLCWGVGCSRMCVMQWYVLFGIRVLWCVWSLVCVWGGGGVLWYMCAHAGVCLFVLLRKRNEKHMKNIKMTASIQKKKKDQNTHEAKTRSGSNRYSFFSVYVTFGNLFISPSLCVFFCLFFV